MRPLTAIVALFIAAALSVGCANSGEDSSADSVSAKTANCSTENDPNSSACQREENELKTKCDADKGTLQERFSCAKWQEFATKRRHEALMKDIETVRATGELAKLLAEVVQIYDEKAADSASWRYRAETSAWAEKNYCPAIIAQATATQHTPTGPLDFETRAKNLMAINFFPKPLFDCQGIIDLSRDARLLLTDSLERNLKLPATACGLKDLYEVGRVQGMRLCRYGDRLCEMPDLIADKWEKSFPAASINEACPDREKVDYFEYVIN